MFQVRRLDSATRKESKQFSDAANSDGSVNKKRKRDSEGDEPNGSEKIKAVNAFRDMGIQQLREQVALRGISTSGSTKELLERLCEDSEKGSNGIPQGM